MIDSYQVKINLGKYNQKAECNFCGILLWYRHYVGITKVDKMPTLPFFIFKMAI